MRAFTTARQIPSVCNAPNECSFCLWMREFGQLYTDGKKIARNWKTFPTQAKVGYWKIEKGKIK